MTEAHPEKRGWKATQSRRGALPMMAGLLLVGAGVGVYSLSLQGDSHRAKKKIADERQADRDQFFAARADQAAKDTPAKIDISALQEKK